jgi:hypothetical protein
VSQDPNGVTRYRVGEHEERLSKIEEAMTELTQIGLLVNQIVEQTAENKKAVRGIFISIIVGVSMLAITTLIAKLT